MKPNLLKIYLITYELLCGALLFIYCYFQLCSCTLHGCSHVEYHNNLDVYLGNIQRDPQRMQSYLSLISKKSWI